MITSILFSFFYRMSPAESVRSCSKATSFRWVSNSAILATFGVRNNINGFWRSIFLSKHFHIFTCLLRYAGPGVRGVQLHLSCWCLGVSLAKLPGSFRLKRSRCNVPGICRSNSTREYCSLSFRCSVFCSFKKHLSGPPGGG